MDSTIFYLNLIATMLIPIFGFFSFARVLGRSPEKLLPPTVYASIFIFLFSMAYLVSTLRILMPGHDTFFQYLTSILHPISLIFAVAFCVSILWPKRVKPSFIICSFITLPYIILAFVLEKEVIEIASGVTEVIFPQPFLTVTLLTTTPLGFLPAIMFWIYSLKTKWGSLRRNGFFMAISFLIISVFACTLDWPGLFSSYLPVFRTLTAIGVILFYIAFSQFQEALVPSLQTILTPPKKRKQNGKNV